MAIPGFTRIKEVMARTTLVLADMAIQIPSDNAQCQAMQFQLPNIIVARRVEATTQAVNYRVDILCRAIHV